MKFNVNEAQIDWANKQPIANTKKTWNNFVVVTERHLFPESFLIFKNDVSLQQLLTTINHSMAEYIYQNSWSCKD